jgi:copper chaperone NosL
MTNTSRIIIGISAVLLAAVYFVPFWSIYLIAPQYPEGLSMQIWLYQLTGDVEIINGLNHYIGMKHIKAEMFPEFDFLVYIVAAYIALGLIVALAGKRWMLFSYIALFLVGGVVALVDFYMWGYDYGHDLDPKAAIQVPGLTYQPPLIGHKKLLNFDAFSYPDTGAWIAIAIVSGLIIIWFIEWRRQRLTARVSSPGRLRALSVAMITAVCVISCNPEPEKIQIGKDVCAECKMIIADPKFGGEVVTKKGKVFKFDDVHCVAIFLERRGVELSDIHKTYFVNYEGVHEFIDVKNAEFVLSSSFRSPMAGNAAAFPNRKVAEERSAGIEGSRVTNWSTLYNILIK